MTPTVLVVDDEILIADVVAAALCDDGFEAITAINGRHALDLLEQYPQIRLVIADWMMPVMDGLSLLRRIKMLPSHYAILSILMSALPEANAQRNEIGYSAFVTKPFRIDDMVQLVRQVVCADPRWN